VGVLSFIFILRGALNEHEGLEYNPDIIVNDTEKQSLRGAKRRACALERFGAQAWQSSKIASRSLP